MRHFYFIIFFLLIQLLSPQLADAQSAIIQSEEKFQERCTYLLDKGGIWEAPNAQYDSTQQWSPTAFGYKFEKGIHPNILKIQIYGVIQGKKYSYWEGYNFWNAAEQRAGYFSIGSGGQIARGDALNAAGHLYFEIFNPDGTTSQHLDIHEIKSENEMEAQSYVIKNGKWEANNRFVWKRMTAPNK